MTILEIVTLLTIGLSSFNIKEQVPSDIPSHGQYIASKDLKSQEWINKINDWTNGQKMIINENKTKTMIFNYTEKYQFTTRLSLKGKGVEVIEKTKLLGTEITNDLKWDCNTATIVKKANARMELVRRVASFGTSVEDLKTIYILFVRSHLEQSATVWHSSLTQDNRDDLERVQKSALKIILQEKYINYKNALNHLNIESLEDRREEICLNFAKKCVKNKKLKSMFPLNDKNHPMELRENETYKVQFAHNERLKKSSIVYMQRLLNQNEN